MANVDAPFGFKPIKHLDGSEYNGQVNRYSIGTGEAALFVGDLVTLSGTSNTDGVPGISRVAAGTGNPAIGAIVEFEADRENQGKTNHPASTAGFALVADAPDVIYEAQATTIAVTDVGNNAPILATAGSTTTGTSAEEVDGSGYVGTTEQVRVLRVKQASDNEVGANAVVEVFINEHVYKEVAGV